MRNTKMPQLWSEAERAANKKTATSKSFDSHYARRDWLIKTQVMRGFGFTEAEIRAEYGSMPAKEF